MTTFNETGLKLAEEIKLNPEYSHIKKEALIEFGFDPIKMDEFVDWVSCYYIEDFEEITGDDIDEERECTSEFIDLITESEREEIGDILEEDNDPNKVIAYITADGETVQATKDIENRKRKERFAIVNKKEWLEIGKALKKERLELDISLAEMGRILKTSPSRISSLENGNGVMMADHLRASYKLVLDLERMKQQEEKTEADKDTQINHIQIVHEGGELYIINLITESGTVIHIRDIEELKSAHQLAQNKFAKHLNVPIVLKMINGEKVRLDVEHSYC